jgi:cytidine deaminase
MVGAALITEDDSVYTGCNVENASYGATNCAERTAIFKAVSEGERLIKAIARVGGVKDGDMTYAYPCGVCRQVLREFSNPGDLVIIVAKNQGDYKKYSLEELLPESFGPDFKSAK